MPAAKAPKSKPSPKPCPMRKAPVEPAAALESVVGEIAIAPEVASGSLWKTGAHLARRLEGKPHFAPLYAALNNIRCRVLPGKGVVEYYGPDIERARENGVYTLTLPLPALTVPAAE